MPRIYKILLIFLEYYLILCAYKIYTDVNVFRCNVVADKILLEWIKFIFTRILKSKIKCEFKRQFKMSNLAVSDLSLHEKARRVKRWLFVANSLSPHYLRGNVRQSGGSCSSVSGALTLREIAPLCRMTLKPRTQWKAQAIRIEK